MAHGKDEHQQSEDLPAMALGQFGAALQAAPWTQPLDDASWRSHKPHRYQDQAGHDEEQARQNHENAHQKTKQKDGYEARQTDAKRLTKTDRPRAHGPKRHVHDDGLAESVVEQEKPHGADKKYEDVGTIGVPPHNGTSQ